MIEGSCDCGALRWRPQAEIAEATACNCTACRRYSALWAYDFRGGRARGRSERSDRPLRRPRPLRASAARRALRAGSVALSSRIERHRGAEAELAALGDAEHCADLEAIAARGHGALVLRRSSARVFAKLLPLSALELRPENRYSTANFFELHNACAVCSVHIVEAPLTHSMNST
jgi:hypothetical protein